MTSVPGQLQVNSRLTYEASFARATPPLLPARAGQCKDLRGHLLHALLTHLVGSFTMLFAAMAKEKRAMGNPAVSTSRRVLALAVTIL